MTATAHSRLRRTAATLAVLCAIAPAPAASREGAPTSGGRLVAEWEWPLRDPRLVETFVAPAHEYGPGHRGIDLASTASDEVRAPDGGVVAFTGAVGGRGVLTLDHGGGVVSTLEPVTPLVEVGVTVRRGEIVGILGEGGHALPGTLHLGARVDGAYVDPLLFLGGMPRAVLLPCC